MRSGGRRGSPRLGGPPATARPARRRGRSCPDELVDEVTELALELDMAIGPADEVDAAIRPEAGPYPPTRQVEGDREPDDQRREGQPDESLPRVALGDEQRVVAERPQRHRQPEALERLGLTGDDRRP